MSRKNLLITGASKGLGKEIKNYYLNKNYNLINLSRSSLKNQSNLVNIRNDLTNFKKTINTFKKVKKKYKKLDAIICCTGSGKKISNDELNKDVIQHYLDLNLFTIINTVNSYLKIFKNQSIKIVIISSIVSKKIVDAPIGYSISKRALDYFIKIFAKKYSNSKININIISPGNLHINGNSWDKKLQKNKKQVLKYINQEVPLKSFIKPRDILPILDILISKNTVNITGSDFIIDGGQSI
jgi:3-oxoacyl-[acyl-carrier protein] reductase